MAGVRRMIWGGIALLALGLLWTSLWKDWGDLWKIVKGGVGLLLFFGAIVFLIMGFFQRCEDRETALRQEEENQRKQEQKAAAG